jgi:hypothetical protein
MNLNRRLQQQTLLNKKLQRLLNSSVQQTEEIKLSTDNALKPAALEAGLATKANLSHTHSVSDITGLAGIATTGLTSAQSYITSNVTLSLASVWYTVTSLSLSSGTWLLLSNITLQRPSTGFRAFSARLTDGTTTYTSGSQGMASQTGNATQISCSTIVTLTNQTTISVQAATGTTITPADYVTATDVILGTEKASGLVAIRIG